MKRKALIALLAILVLSFNLISCNNINKSLNQSMVITDDVKADTEAELKVISTEIIPLENYIKDFFNIYVEKDDGSTLVRQNFINGNLMQNINLKIYGDKAIGEYEDYFEDEYRNISKSFYLESLGNNKVLITDWYSDNTFEVEEGLISNEKSRYEVSGEYLIELVNGPVIKNYDSKNIAWTNLNTGSDGTIKISEEMRFIAQSVVVEDKLFLSAVSNTALEETSMYIDSNPDTLLVVDLTTNKVIEKSNITRFKYFYPIDDERIIFTLDKENEEVIEMYNLNNKTRKELMKYSSVPGDGLITFGGLSTFPSRDKIYYCEDDGEKISIKIAEINGMDIENVITAYEVDKKDSENFSVSNISISNDEREIKVFNTILTEYGFFIDKIIKIKLNK